MKRSLVVVLATAVIASMLVLLAPAPASAGLPPSEWVIGPRKPNVLVVFDGHARAKQLLKVLDILKQKRATASFFMSGRWVQHHQAKVKRLVAEGHELGNRGYEKDPFTSLSNDALRASIARAAQELRAVGASPAPFLRAPNGQRDLRVLNVAGSTGYRSVRWTYQARGGLARKVTRKVSRRLQAGAIIDLDLWRRSHRRALPKIIDAIRAKGFGMRTLDKLRNAHAVRWDVTLKAGATGPEVYYLQKKLRSITYPAGATDSEFGYATLQAVYAFEKVHGLTRDGVVPPSQMAAIAKARRPRAPKRAVKTFIDVDISRQVIFEVRDGRVVHTSPTSTGNDEYYYVDGQRYKAYTPRGEFQIERKILGRRDSRLGTLWNPLYFVGGWAFHGSESVPTYPASHGCARLPMYISRPFFDRNPIGTKVYVHN